MRSFNYTGEDDEVPDDVTHVTVDHSVTVIPQHAFSRNRNIVALRLRKEKVITQFSHPLLALFFVLRPMIPLTFITAILNELAIGIACRQFDVIHLSDTAGSTKRRHVDLASLSTIGAQPTIILLPIFVRHITITAPEKN